MLTTGPQDLRPVRHEAMTWTSFDRFGRYATIAELLRKHVGSGGFLVDVGDASGYLERFLPERQTVAVDLHRAEAPFAGVRFAQADGTALPFPDGAAAAALSCDALEHLPEPARDEFVGELCRVARDAVLVAAPFDTFGVRGAEDLVARYAKVLLGADQPQLTEHAERGLPNLAATASALARRGWDVEISGEGNLHDWVGMMLLRFSTDAHTSTVPLGDGLDVLYNNLLHHRSGTAPYYRHLLVATPAAGSVGEVRGLEEALTGDQPLIDTMAASFVGQASLLATAPTLRRVEYTLDQVEAVARRTEDAVRPGGSSISGLEEAMRAVGARVETVSDQIEALRAEQEDLRRRLELQHRRSIIGVAGRVRRRLRGR